MTVNRTRDFIERVVWTAIQAAGGFLLDDLINGKVVVWQSIAIAAALASLKVLVAQNVGDSNSGDAFPGGVIQRDTGV